MQTQTEERALVIMGVSGCGKSSLAQGLAALLGLDWLDADDFHSPANIQNMARGIALADKDRWPWLAAVGSALADMAKRQRPAILACSALKADYRRALERASGLPLTYLQLDAPRALLQDRLENRRGHFMGSALLDSQLATLEPLRLGGQDPEAGLVLDASQPVADLVDQIQQWLATSLG